jgi:hypothetical protein
MAGSAAVEKAVNCWMFVVAVAAVAHFLCFCSWVLMLVRMIAVTMVSFEENQKRRKHFHLSMLILGIDDDRSLFVECHAF